MVTVAAQVYTNVQNYKVNKQRFELDVQQALDLAVESYYADRARNDVIIYTTTTELSDSIFMKRGLSVKGDFSIDSAIKFSTSIQSAASWKTSKKKSDSVRAPSFSTFAIETDSTTILRINPDSIKGIEVMNHIAAGDSLELQLMAKKILASLVDNSLDFEVLGGFLNDEFERKDIDIAYSLIHTTPAGKVRTSEANFELASFSKSTYLPKNQSLEIRYENASLAILKRGAFDLFISLLIIMAVVGALLYLYRVINEQKELAEIKNDLISNITHEFKTPIATISTAIEGISIFNEENDPEKTKKYLGISSDQLKKLNTMVEKLLETASIDSDEIDLTLESVDTVQLTQMLIEKFDMVKGEKNLSFESELRERLIDLDQFHMENAISNLIDNALKYGGDQVSITLRAEGDKTIWQVVDNGGQLDKQQQARIFEKFYRVPTGNVHNVKGFGIGLYYTKTMIEKHGGIIDLEVANGQTKFTITI